MPHHLVPWGLALALAWGVGQERKLAQGDPRESSLGPAPGSGGSPLDDPPGAGGGIIGGRPGPSAPRVLEGITRPGQETPARPGGRGIGPVPALPSVDLPPVGSLESPIGPEDEGPPDGLDLDAAIERLVRTNLDLRSKAVEIPKAQADILTAGLRANPYLYFDTQLIPYGRYSDERPGGPIQYDLNVTYPLDVSGKRRARTLVACAAKRVLEAQYQDAVRLTIDSLYTAFVDVQAAREAVRFAQAGVTGLRRLLQLTRELEQKGEETRANVLRAKSQVDIAELGLVEAEEALRDAKQTLAVLLNLPPHGVESLEVRGSIRDESPASPPVELLIHMALAGRPDLNAYRLGIRRAAADVGLAKAERLQDIFVLYQPYTFQDTNPKGSHSWTLGVTVPLPIYNRNQGNIQRAKVNVTQTQIQLADLERRVIDEVQRAARAYAVTRAAAERFERDLLVDAREARDATNRAYKAGETNLTSDLDAQRQYNEVFLQYRDTLIRHRRSSLQLNTVVGRRIFP